MNNENNQLKTNNDTFSNDESKGLNEDVHYENARNDYQNHEPVIEKNEKTGQVRANDVDDDINVSEHGHQKTTGSIGAFPVGAFDTSKD